MAETSLIYEARRFVLLSAWLGLCKRRERAGVRGKLKRRECQEHGGSLCV